MNRRSIGAIIRKDLKVVRQSKMVMLPLIVMPLILLVLLPVGLILPIQFIPEEMFSTSSDIDELLSSLPASLRSELSGMDEKEIWVRYSILHLSAPLFLIIPMMTASVIAADSFAGEKERKTIEALLHTPITDEEMLVAKLLTAWLPAIAITLVGFAVYAIMANLMGWLVIGRIFFPNLTWVVLVVWVSPAVAGLSLGVMVLVSARVQTFQEAYQFGGMVVLPLVALMIGQVAGVISFNLLLALLLGLTLWVIDGVLLWTGQQTFRREKLIAGL